MEDAKTMQRGFTGYEYKEVTAESSRASFLIDGYECFGWELDENFPESRKTGNAGNLKKMVIRLKRSRKIVNKMELTRLQRNFEACVNEIDTLEKAKTSTAAMRDHCRDHRHCLYGGIGFCGNSRAAPDHTECNTCGSRVSGVDHPLFSVQKDGEKTDGETDASDRRKTGRDLWNM